MRMSRPVADRSSTHQEPAPQPLLPTIRLSLPSIGWLDGECRQATAHCASKAPSPVERLANAANVALLRFEVLKVVEPGLLGPLFPDIAHHTTASFLTLPSILALHATSPLLLNAYSHEVTAMRLRDPRPRCREVQENLNECICRLVSSLLYRFTHLRELQVPFRGFVSWAALSFLHEHGHATLASLAMVPGKYVLDGTDDFVLNMLELHTCSSRHALLPCLTSLALHVSSTILFDSSEMYGFRGGLLSCCPRLTELYLSGSIVEPVLSTLLQHPPMHLTRLSIQTPSFSDVHLLYTALPRALQHLRIFSCDAKALDVLATWLFETKAPQLLSLEFKRRQVVDSDSYGWSGDLDPADALVDALCSADVAPSLQYLDLFNVWVTKSQRRRLVEARGAEALTMVLDEYFDGDDYESDYDGVGPYPDDQDQSDDDDGADY